jgi:hypothetical protein
MKDTKFVICIDNSDFPVSLEIRKIYKAIPDSDIDESGEDYLYPISCFIDANLSKETQEAVAKVA